MSSYGFAPLLPGMEPITYEDRRGHEIWFMLRQAVLNSENFIDIHVCDMTSDVEDDATEFFSMPTEVAVKIAEAILRSQEEK